MPRYNYSRQILNGVWDFQPVYTNETTLSCPTDAWSKTPLLCIIFFSTVLSMHEHIDEPDILVKHAEQQLQFSAS